MSKTNKLAFICQPYHKSGVTAWMADAAVYLSNIGVEVSVITVNPTHEFIAGRGKSTMVSLVSGNGSKVRVVKEDVGTEFEFGTPQYQEHLYRQLILKNIEAGTPIIPSDVLQMWDIVATVIERHPLVGVLHCDSTYYYNIPPIYKPFISLYVGVSEKICLLVHEKFPEIPTSKIFDIPCGIELPAKQLVAEYAAKRKDNDVLQLVFIGRFEAPEKRAGDVFAVSELLKAQQVPHHVTIMGNDPAHDAKYIELFKAKGLAENITLNGWTHKKEIQKILSVSDIMLLPSDYEGMPIVMMEAFSTGCGFVGSRVSGVDQFEHHPDAQNCVGVFAIGDIAGAVEKIKKVAAIPRQIRQQEARALAEKYFDIDVCMKKYIAAIGTMTPIAAKNVPFSFSFKDMLQSRVLAFMRNAKLQLKGGAKR